ncbi:MAG: DNA-processing protein DprA [Agarilytica sp.]
MPIQDTVAPSSLLSTLEKTLLILSVSGLGVVRYWTLVDALGGVDKVFAAPREQLNILLRPALVDQIDDVRQRSDHPSLIEVRRALEWCRENNIHVLSHIDPAYPSMLSEIAQAPPYLFVKGDLSVLARDQVAIVGSRSASKTGLANAHHMAAELVGRDFVVTSGLALGIDGHAHSGALSGGGQTVAVVGTGIDTVYPKRHGQLAQDILENGGAIVSEFPLGAVASPQNFPRRNRIISGLSLGTLVIEAAVKSGSLITAKYALEQNREVFAMPGSVHSPLSRGCHTLIKQGGILVECAEDIYAELEGFAAKTSAAGGYDSAVDANISDEERHILDRIEYDPMSLDAIASVTDLGVNTLLSGLMSLEMSGHIYNENGHYVKAVKP